MPPRTRDNNDERLARIALILEDVRQGSEHQRTLARQAKARAVIRCREARALVHDVREARAERAAGKR